MIVRHSPRPAEVERMTTDELRDAFLIRGLFEPGRINLVATGVERMIAGGIVPDAAIALPALRELGTGYFLERREAGVINIGEPGAVIVGGTRHELDRLECLYIGAGERDVCFTGTGAAFFLLSCPAHARYPVAKAQPSSDEAGQAERASKRRIRKCIRPGGVASAQLVMGFTELEPGNVWNTMPAHTHSRRSEVYLYFDLPADGAVVHLLGEPRQTRHLIVREREAVILPEWSVHSGAGTGSYRFIWGMAGENQDFTDMDPVAMSELA